MVPAALIGPRRKIASHPVDALLVQALVGAAPLPDLLPTARAGDEAATGVLARDVDQVSSEAFLETFERIGVELALAPLHDAALNFTT